MSHPASAPPAGKRARTRERLVEAAAAVFAARGFHGATLDDVAREAGLTKGAIYGNFHNKEELFLAIFEKPAFGVRPVFRAGGSLEDQMRRLGEAVVAFLATAHERGVLFAEFQRYVQTHPGFRAELETRAREQLEIQAANFRPFIPESEIGMPLAQFIVILDALIDGLLLQRAQTPALVTDEVVLAAFERLAR